MSADTPQARAAAVRRGAGLFRLAGRGVVGVSGEDARRWLNGMVSNEVGALDPDGPERHCHALLLSPIGRILADLQVVARPGGFWLDLERRAVPDVLERLERYIIADDVSLRDASEEIARLAVEGPEAARVVEGAAAALAQAEAVVVEYALGGGPGRQLFVPAAASEAVETALRAAGGPGLVEGDADTLEVLRVEAGIPRQFAELDEEVLPPEARLDAAVSTTKGCYTGQEVVARIRSRGQVKHLLVGLRFPAGEPAAPGDPIERDGRRVGEVTSAVRSPRAGAIALGFVRRPHDAEGTALRAGGRPAEVVSLPFVRGGG